MFNTENENAGKNVLTFMFLGNGLKLLPKVLLAVSCDEHFYAFFYEPFGRVVISIKRHLHPTSIFQPSILGACVRNFFPKSPSKKEILPGSLTVSSLKRNHPQKEGKDHLPFASFLGSHGKQSPVDQG